MTEPVKGISGTEGTTIGGHYSGGISSDGHKRRVAHAVQSDLIEISRDARNRSTGKKKKSLFEYLKELFD